MSLLSLQRTQCEHDANNITARCFMSFFSCCQWTPETFRFNSLHSPCLQPFPHFTARSLAFGKEMEDFPIQITTERGGGFFGISLFEIPIIPLNLVLSCRPYNPTNAFWVFDSKPFWCEENMNGARSVASLQGRQSEKQKPIFHIPGITNKHTPCKSTAQATRKWVIWLNNIFFPLQH